MADLLPSALGCLMKPTILMAKEGNLMDLPADISTPATLEPNTSVSSTLELISPEIASDEDFFRVLLEAEQVYSVSWELLP
ncbi:hypothetical protein, partial [Aestuariicoccus sp. MJ-SS9]|uniref:hypothetical protein n=1 Tax=Aestuariicoccus sp. MJ-SS9 TaxID=3079855 RepID=UPI00290CE212